MRRRLIINADDFGASHSINATVIRAHREGVLTTASLMVNGDAFDEAVAMARANPGLGVGLHLAFLFGKSTLPCEEIPGLVDADRNFSNHPAWSGVRYFFNPFLRDQLRREMRAQFLKFQKTNLPMDHLNGHLHMHLHPAIFPLVLELMDEFEFRHVRWTREPLSIDWKISRGAAAYRLSHAVIFRVLSALARRPLRRRGARFTQSVFGLFQNAKVSEDYVLRLLPLLPEGDSELYSHPCTDHFKHEFDALMSPRVKAALVQERIERIRYQDL